MSHLADSLSTERVFYTTAYYHQDAWPHFFDRSVDPIPQSSAYTLPANASSFAVDGNWDNASSSSTISSASEGANNATFPTRQSHSQVYTHLPTPYSSQSHLQQAETIETPSYPSLYSFEDDRNRSPSPISEYTVWDSPKSSVDHQEQETESRPPHIHTEDFNHSRNIDPGQSQPAVKVEDHDDCFIMELTSADMFTTAGKMGGGMRTRGGGASATHLSSLSISQSLAPPTEVPLRATQASDEMRARMGVFRLNPFTMHSLSVNADDAAIQDDVEWEATQPPWCGGEPHALDEEPLLYEFQLDLFDAANDVQEARRDGRGTADQTSSSRSNARSPDTMGDVASNNGGSHLHRFSPDFELHPMDEDTSVVTSHKDSSPCSQNQAQDHHQQDRDHVCPTGETDYANHSELESSSTTTHSAHTFIGSPRTVVASFAQQQQQQQQRCSSSLRSSMWDAVNEQYSPSVEASFPVRPLPMGSKTSIHMECETKRLSGMHVASPRPYMHRSFQYQHTNESPAQGPYGVPKLHSSRFPLLSQPPQHAVYAIQQPSYLSTEPSYRQPSYHENGLTQSKAMASPRRSVTQNTDILSAYMRSVRGPRSRDDDLRQEDGIYDHHIGNQSELEAKEYSSSLEQVSQSTPTAMIAHYMSHIDGAVSGNRRWSLPETTTGHSQSGHFLS